MKVLWKPKKAFVSDLLCFGIKMMKNTPLLEKSPLSLPIPTKTALQKYHSIT